MAKFKFYDGTNWVELAKKTDIPSAVTESTVSGWGFTKNAGTVVSVNNTSPDANGNVSLTIPSAVTSSTVSGWGFGTYSKPSGGIPASDLADTYPKMRYEHNILIFKASSGYFINFRLLTNNSAAITTYNNLAKALNGCDYKTENSALACIGAIYQSNKLSMVTGIYGQSTTAIRVRTVDLASLSSSTLTIAASPTATAACSVSSSGFNIQDYVRDLSSKDYTL